MTDELYDPRLLVRVHRIYYVSWNGLYWLNSCNWIGASLFLPFGGRWWLESAWQWMANHFFPSSGRKSRKTNEAILVKLGCSTWNKDSVRWTIVSVEGFGYNGYQCRFIHVTYTYSTNISYIAFFSRSCCHNLVIPTVPPFIPWCIACQESIFQDAASKPQKEGGRWMFFKREDVSGHFIVFENPWWWDLFLFFQRGKVLMENDFKVYQVGESATVA